MTRLGREKMIMKMDAASSPASATSPGGPAGPGPRRASVQSTSAAAKPSAASRRRDSDDPRAERKRIQDRLAQRATRERTKNRIAYLEQRLNSLEAGDKQGEIASLTQIIDRLRNDNHRLRNTLVKMRTSIDQAILTTEDPASGVGGDDVDRKSTAKPCGCKIECACADSTSLHHGSRDGNAVIDPAITDGGRHDSVSTDTSDVTEVVNGQGISMAAGMAAGMSVGGMASTEINGSMDGLTGLEDFFDFNPHALLEMFEMGPSSVGGYGGGNGSWMMNPAAAAAASAATPSPFDYRFPSPSPRVAPDVDKWHVSNGAFISALDSVRRRNSTNVELDLHVPFKAAIWGWDNVGPEASHPVWNALRQVDQRVFGSWTSKAQRIALMYVCQTLIQYRENSTKENLDRVPVFLRPRPSQEKIQHPAVIDFLVWPGLRDRLVFEHKKYTSTGSFSAAFVENFSFHWPYSDSEIFAYSPVHNRYEVSKIFLEYAYNFKNWTMKPGFFKKFPEMQHDIAAFEETVDFPRASWTM